MWLSPSVLQARSAQLKAVMLSERVLGFDHPSTIQQYVSTQQRGAAHPDPEFMLC